MSGIGPLDLPWWQWLAVAGCAAGAWIVGLVLGRITRKILGHLVARTSVTWDDAVLARLGGPMTAAWGFAAFYLAVAQLELSPAARGRIATVSRSALFLLFLWALVRSVDVLAEIVLRSTWARDRAGARALVPLGRRVVKVVVVAMSAVALLSQLGYPVASLVAGLGIGGLALALAAQKTVENLFGAFSIGVDQPFREGDFVKVEDFVATVEAVGLRSTRFRTLDRTLITIPNGRLADMRVESFTVRDRIRLFCVLGLVYSTTPVQMKRVLAGLERVLRQHPKIWAESLTVRFREFAASSLDVEIMAWFQTQDWNEFLAIRQQVFLEFMQVVEDAGSSFAFPTRTVHHVQAAPTGTSDGLKAAAGGGDARIEMELRDG